MTTSKTQELILERFAYTPHGTFGRLKTRGFECFTVERPWVNNEPSDSCIPEGWYKIKLGWYNKGNYAAYEVENCYNRSHIKIHIGNTMKNVTGCIALGSELGYVDSKWAVLSSKNTYHKFMSIMNHVNNGSLRIIQFRA